MTGTVRVSFVVERYSTSRPPALTSDEITDPSLLACVARGFEGLLLYAAPGAA